MQYRTRQSPQQWESLIQEQEQSSLSQKAFCLNHDISHASFTKWRQKLRGSNNEFIPISPQETPAPKSSFSLTVDWGRFSMSVTL